MQQLKAKAGHPGQWSERNKLRKFPWFSSSVGRLAFMLMVCFCAPAWAYAWDISITRDPACDPIIICKGTPIEISLSAAITGTPPSNTAECVVSGPAWSWSGDASGTSSSTTITKTYETAGIYTLTATVEAKYEYANKPGQEGGCPPAETKTKTVEIEVDVVEVDLVIHKPAVIDPGQAAIPEDDELTKGAQTFVNLDNDDRDDKFDTGSGDTSVAGEDEMCKIVLRVKPTDLHYGTVTLEATAGGGDIKVWTAADKGSEFDLSTSLSVADDFTAEGDWLVKELWVEGIQPHSAQQGTKLKMTYMSCEAECTDEVALTIIGIESIKWKGKNNSRNDDNALDGDPNHKSPGGGAVTPASLRVFPDARIAAGAVEASPRNKVDVDVTLSVKPIEAVNVYFDSFDVDDPTSAAAPLDNEANPSDNRGAIPAQAGQFTGEAGGVLEKSFADKTATLEFLTTLQPGDNFRLVGNGDKDFLGILRNDDNALGANNDDKQRVIDPAIKPAGTPAEREIREALKYATDILTVWRFLHVERDSMGAVTGNSVSGNITAFTPVGAGAGTDATVSNVIGDGSVDLDAGVPQNGRFEKGTMTVAGVSPVPALTGNGNTRLVKNGGLNATAVGLPFSAIDNDSFWNGTMSGTVTQIITSAGNWHLKISITAQNETPLDWPDFVGGTITVGAGPAMTIVGTSSVTSTVEVAGAGLRIPYSAVDDDSAVMPTMPDTTYMVTPYADAYLLPLIDGGGKLANNKTNVAFALNVDGSTNVAIAAAYNVPNGLESDGNRTDHFWVAYILAAYQSNTAVNAIGRADNDPNSEAALGGVCDSTSRKGALIFVEEVRDQDAEIAAVVPSAPRTVAHEIGHEFGLPDRVAGNGLMSPDLYNNAGVRFSAADLAAIRAHIKGPGR